MDFIASVNRALRSRDREAIGTHARAMRDHLERARAHEHATRAACENAPDRHVKKKMCKEHALAAHILAELERRDSFLTFFRATHSD